MTINVNADFNLTADGDSEAVTISSSKPMQCEAVFNSGSGTIKLVSRVGHGAWNDVSGCSFTATGISNTLILPRFNEQFKANLAGSSGSPDIDLILTQVEGNN